MLAVSTARPGHAVSAILRAKPIASSRSAALSTMSRALLTLVAALLAALAAPDVGVERSIGLAAREIALLERWLGKLML